MEHAVIINRTALVSLRSEVDRLHGRREALGTELAAAAEGLDKAKCALKSVQGLQLLVLELSGRAQDDIQHRVESLVSQCLAAVFPDPYELRAVFDIQGGKPTCQLLFWRDGAYFDPVKATGTAGGGTTDVAQQALRWAQMVLHKPRVRPIVIADEPFKFPSKDLARRLVDLLDALCGSLGMQIIMITHQPELAKGAAKSWRVYKEGNLSLVQETTAVEDLGELVINASTGAAIDADIVPSVNGS